VLLGRRFAGHLPTHHALDRIAKTTTRGLRFGEGVESPLGGPMGPSASGLSAYGPSLDRVQAVDGGAGRSEVQR
jgi:hypothetical protein